MSLPPPTPPEPFKTWTEAFAAIEQAKRDGRPLKPTFVYCEADLRPDEDRPADA